MKVTEFKNVPVERRVMRKRGGMYGYITLRTKEYVRLMKLIEDCQAAGGHVEFKCIEGKVDAKIHWPEKGATG